MIRTASHVLIKDCQSANFADMAIIYKEIYAKNVLKTVNIVLGVGNVPNVMQDIG